MANTPKHELLIFVPTYNEIKNVSVLFKYFEELGLSCDYLFVDDASPDGTGKFLDNLAKNNQSLFVIHRSGKQGIGSAHKLAFDYALKNGYSYLLTMDADLTHHPRYLPAIIKKIQNYDCVIGSRYCHTRGFYDWSFTRRALSFCSHGVTKYFLGLPYDCTGAFRMYNVEKVFKDGFYDSIKSNGYSFFIESIYHIKKSGARIAEVPIIASERYSGESKISRVEIMRAGFRAFYLFGDRIFSGARKGFKSSAKRNTK